MTRAMQIRPEAVPEALAAVCRARRLRATSSGWRGMIGDAEIVISARRRPRPGGDQENLRVNWGAFWRALPFRVGDANPAVRLRLSDCHVADLLMEGDADDAASALTAAARLELVLDDLAHPQRTVSLLATLCSQSTGRLHMTRTATLACLAASCGDAALAREMLARVQCDLGARGLAKRIEAHVLNAASPPRLKAVAG